MSRYFIDAELTSMISEDGDEFSEHEVLVVSFCHASVVLGLHRHLERLHLIFFTFLKINVMNIASTKAWILLEIYWKTK